jgi:hypothetical protein
VQDLLGLTDTGPRHHASPTPPNNVYEISVLCSVPLLIVVTTRCFVFFSVYFSGRDVSGVCWFDHELVGYCDFPQVRQDFAKIVDRIGQNAETQAGLPKKDEM